MVFQTKRRKVVGDIGKLVHAILSHPNKDTLIAELQSNNPYTPFSEESKHMIHSLAIVESFKLCERPHTKFSVFIG